MFLCMHTSNLALIIVYSNCIGIISVVHGSCTHGAVQLVNSSTTNIGRVEVCVGNTWGTATVCGNRLFTSEARVVCRQLGYNVDKFGSCKFIYYY